jgi:hypothetical protein
MKRLILTQADRGLLRGGSYTKQCPAELVHGKSADFMVSFLATPNWQKDFPMGFIKDLSDRSLKTLVALVQTSVGQSIEVQPEKQLLARLKTAG